MYRKGISFSQRAQTSKYHSLIINLKLRLRHLLFFTTELSLNPFIKKLPYILDTQNCFFRSHPFPWNYTLIFQQWKENKRLQYLIAAISGASGKEPACQSRRRRFDPWVGKIPWRRAWQHAPVFLPGESHGQRSLLDYSPQGQKELNMMEVT